MKSADFSCVGLRKLKAIRRSLLVFPAKIGTGVLIVFQPRNHKQFVPRYDPIAIGLKISKSFSSNPISYIFIKKLLCLIS